MQILRFVPFFAAIVILALPARAEVLGEHGPWIASKLAEADKPVCHMSAMPDKAEGKYAKRGQPYAIVTHRPAEKTVGEVSFQAGYTFKADSAVSVTIDRNKPFELFTNGGFAWARTRDDDKALVKAMRGGSRMVVKGTSSRGTLTTDTYSLSGFTAAYKAISSACGVK